MDILNSPHTQQPGLTADAASRDADLALLTKAVREAGALAMRYFRQRPERRRKADGTEVSEADLAVDASLRTALCGARPGYGWLSEETPDDRVRLARRRVWTVDPIDGTRAFLADVPEWTIAAALVEGGRPVLAAVYNPAQGEFFYAAEGRGSYLNADTIRVSQRAEIEDSLLIVAGGFVRRRGWARPWPPVRTRWVNSVAYRLALVAGGAYDATVSLSKKSDWDLAAADLMVREAGGRVTTHRGDALIYNRPEPVHDSVVAAGAPLHGALIARTRALDLAAR